MVTPISVNPSVTRGQMAVLLVGLGVMLASNAVLLRLSVAPLHRLMALMRSVDVLQPGRRLNASGTAEVAEVITVFNATLERLEEERRASMRRVLSAQEAERRRIAQELHDQIGQNLTAVVLELKRLQGRVEPGGPRRWPTPRSSPARASRSCAGSATSCDRRRSTISGSRAPSSRCAERSPAGRASTCSTTSTRAAAAGPRGGARRLPRSPRRRSPTPFAIGVLARARERRREAGRGAAAGGRRRPRTRRPADRAVASGACASGRSMIGGRLVLGVSAGRRRGRAARARWRRGRELEV